MEHYQWLYVGLGAAAASVLTWGACYWWFGRQLASAMKRIEKLDKLRLFLGQQVMQARRQVEKLQRDSAAVPRRPATPPTRSAQLEAVLRSVDGISGRTPSPANGFADTQTL